MPAGLDDTGSEETRWTDARIRWPEDADSERDRNKSEKNGLDDDDEYEGPLQDPFKDDNPMQTFNFHFSVPRRIEGGGESGGSSSSTGRMDHLMIDIEIKGYKDDSDQVWESTGLTVWRAAEHLWCVPLGRD
jgi:hypothetical protein